MNSPYPPHIGQINRLKVVQKQADGLLLNGGRLGEIFLPAAEAPQAQVDELVEVFLYVVDQRTLATSKTPKALPGECAALKVQSVGKFGAFLDWGIDKDLLLPGSEQAGHLEPGERVVVYIKLDPRTGQAVATARLHQHLEESSGPYKTGDQVDLLIAARTEIGYKAVINDEYLGLVFHSDLSQPLRIGERMKGWIKAVRDDGKVDLSINLLDAGARDELQQKILDAIQAAGGRLPMSDKTPPEEIFKKFRVSKKNFKRALSALYKARLIQVYPEYVELV